MSRKAHVLYEYVSQDDDQLTIKAGDIITILDDSADLNGWALAQNGNKEGYVPAEYVRYIDNNNNNNDEEWIPETGFEVFYNTVLSQEHHLPFTFKLMKSLRDVLIPCPCSKFSYVMSRSDLRRGALFSLLISFIVSVVDVFSILSPILPINTHEAPTISTYQIFVCVANVVLRMMLTLIFLNRYPRPNLVFVSFPFLNVIASMTYSIRVYEILEMGDNKEYDGYRYYRTWMWSSIANAPFNLLSLLLVILNVSNGLIAVSVFVLVWNCLNFGRCFLAAWANVESGKDINPHFAETIKKYHL